MSAQQRCARLGSCIPLLALAAIAAAACAQQPASGVPDGNALMQAGKFAEAREVFEQTLRSNPQDQDAQTGEVSASERLALDARSAGNFDEALQTLLRARALVPHHPRLLTDLGILEDQMSLFKDADDTLTEAERLSPGDATILYALARVKMDRSSLGPAEDKMKAYLELRPTDASAHYGLGRIYEIGLQFDKARVEFVRSIELQPAQTLSYYELGDMALKQGDLDEALKQFAKTLARDPKHGGALEGSGEACFKQKRYAEAKDFLERAIAAAPDYAPSHYYLGLTLARLGQKEDSERELAAATKLADAENKQSAGQMRLQSPAHP